MAAFLAWVVSRLLLMPMNDLIDCLRECLAEFKEERELATQHIVRAAANSPLPSCVGIVPASVFELAEREAHTRWGTVAANDARKPDSVLIITREIGRVCCQSVPFGESEEGVAKERARRARQRPPRPIRQKSLRLKNSKSWQRAPARAPTVAGPTL